jgi:hypothetical protein
MIRCATQHHRRRGFATFSAVVLVGLATVALTMFAGITIRQLERTRDAGTDAQLRQLLIAGRTIAQQYTPSDLAPLPEQQALPAALAEAGGATLTLEAQPSTETANATVTITAVYEHQTATQTLSYDPAQQRWRIIDAQLP